MSNETPSSESEQAPADAPAGAANNESLVTPSSSQAGIKPSYTFLIILTLINLVADLASKGWAKGYFEAVQPGEPRKIVVYEDWLQFIYAQNRGGAWGFLQNETESIRRPFFLIVSVAAIVFIVSLYRKLAPNQTALKWGLPLVLGGALGNLVDRVRYGFVVDFIDIFTFWDGRVRHWPTFNIADVSICVGVILMAIDMFTARAPAPDAKPKHASPAPTPTAAKVDDATGEAGI